MWTLDRRPAIPSSGLESSASSSSPVTSSPSSMVAAAAAAAALSHPASPGLSKTDKTAVCMSADERRASLSLGHLSFMHHLPYYYTAEQLKTSASMLAGHSPSLFTIDSILAPRPHQFYQRANPYLPYAAAFPPPHDLFAGEYLSYVVCVKRFHKSHLTLHFTRSRCYARIAGLDPNTISSDNTSSMIPCE